MKDKQSYEEMLDIPENSSNIILKSVKKKKLKKKPLPEQVKQELVDKVNCSLSEAEGPAVQSGAEEQSVTIRQTPKIKMTVTAIQTCVIGLLLAVILVTNALNVNSGINVFLRGLLGTDSQSVWADNRLYFDFTPVLNVENATTTVDDDGNLLVTGYGSAYSPCDGVVKALSVDENGEYTVTISHNDYFSSTISGLNYCYVFEGDNVYGNIPVGYARDKSYSMCFTGSDGAVVTGYTVENNQVIWAV